MAAAGGAAVPAGPQDRTLENFMDQASVQGADDDRFGVGEVVDVWLDDEADIFVLGQIIDENPDGESGYTVRFRDPDPTMLEEGKDYRDMRVPLAHASSMIRKRTPFVPGPSAVPAGPPANPYTVDRPHDRPQDQPEDQPEDTGSGAAAPRRGAARRR